MSDHEHDHDEHDHSDCHDHDHDDHDHDAHEHDHQDHSHDLSKATQRALTWALILNGGFLIIEATVGFITNSLALLSDAGHMIGDVAALGVALAASIAAGKSASMQKSFGWVRAEVLGAFLNAVALLVICGFIVHEAIDRMVGETPEVASMPILVVGIIGLLINLGSALNLARGDRENMNVRGALAHMLADALGSVGAILAAVFLYLGFPLADPVISLLTVALILWGTVSLLRDSSRVLLQFAPSRLAVEEIEQTLLAIDGVNDIHHLHAWTLDGHRAILTLHMTIEDQRDEPEMRRLAISTLEEAFELDHITIQVEREGEKCEQCECSALKPSESRGHHGHHHHGHAHAH
jgi:cobalt-zinc-cadmium efflux system protein